MIGKWLNRGAELFIFDEPTVGVDVGTKVEIYKLFAQLLRAGAGIILISSYLPEVYDLSDTLHIFRRGKLVATHKHCEASQELILFGSDRRLMRRPKLFQAFSGVNIDAIPAGQIDGNAVADLVNELASFPIQMVVDIGAEVPGLQDPDPLASQLAQETRKLVVSDLLLDVVESFAFFF